MQHLWWKAECERNINLIWEWNKKDFWVSSDSNPLALERLETTFFTRWGVPLPNMANISFENIKPTTVFLLLRFRHRFFHFWFLECLWLVFRFHLLDSFLVVVEVVYCLDLGSIIQLPLMSIHITVHVDLVEPKWAQLGSFELTIGKEIEDRVESIEYTADSCNRNIISILSCFYILWPCSILKSALWIIYIFRMYTRNTTVKNSDMNV